MSTLNLYDTLSRKTSAFIPIKKGEVGIYLCGATVQAPPHIGHVRSGVNFDILRRWLIASGLNVTFIRNVTDIDDKILHKAVHEEIPWWQVAAKYERAFTDAYQALNVMPPSYEPRATGHITQMISLMQKLIDNGAAYAPGNGDVYLEVRKQPAYLSLSNQKLDDLLVGEDADLKFKRDPKDFTLWKGVKKDEPSWPTPWGDGRPGWHLECSAMAHAYLGEAFDIHGGGLDLVFPHHENEIAQSNAAGYKFANTWMHNAWVTSSGEKMSKSLGNSLQVAEILKKVRGIELRWYLAGAHYRSMLEFSFEALNECAIAFRRVEAFLSRAESVIGEKVEISIADEFAAAMNDDLATPQALAFIAQAMRIGNSSADDKEIQRRTASQIRGALSILGCDPAEAAFATKESNDQVIDGLIKLALDQREAARARKDFNTSDEIRDQITSLGVTVEDTTNGARWSY